MKLLNIAVIQSCNYDCYYCTMRKWTYPINDPLNAMTNAILLRWLDKYIDPTEWYIKITGGEPGLYPEIGELIPALVERGYKGYIETNGSLPIPQTENFPRLAAWHEGRPRPKYVDVMLIIQARDHWEAKVKWCADNGMPYYVTMMRGEHSPLSIGERRATDAARTPTSIEAILMVYSSGSLVKCPCGIEPYGYIQHMDEPQPQSTQISACTTCPQTHMIDYIRGLSLWDKSKANTSTWALRILSLSPGRRCAEYRSAVILLFKMSSVIRYLIRNYGKIMRHFVCEIVSAGG